MVRAPYFDKNGIKKGAWSEEEDKKLTAYIETQGHPNWRQLPKFAGLARCGKSCRLRWINYLRPNLKRGKFTQEEEQAIMDLHKEHGNKWSLIAEKLPGRTDNEIKNYWHSHLKKFTQRNYDKITTCAELNSNSIEYTEHDQRPTSEVVSADSDSHNILESPLCLSSETSYMEDNNLTSFSSSHVESTMNWSRVEDRVPSWETFGVFSSSFWTEPFISENAFNQCYFSTPSYGAERDEPFFI